MCVRMCARCALTRVSCATASEVYEDESESEGNAAHGTQLLIKPVACVTRVRCDVLCLIVCVRVHSIDNKYDTWQADKEDSDSESRHDAPPALPPASTMSTSGISASSSTSRIGSAMTTTNTPASTLSMSSEKASTTTPIAPALTPAPSTTTTSGSSRIVTTSSSARAPALPAHVLSSSSSSHASADAAARELAPGWKVSVCVIASCSYNVPPSSCLHAPRVIVSVM
jgi:hypothetical protein